MQHLYGLVGGAGGYLVDDLWNSHQPCIYLLVPDPIQMFVNFLET